MPLTPEERARRDPDFLKTSAGLVGHVPFASDCFSRETNNLSGDGPDGVNRLAREKLFEAFTCAETLARRKVNREFRDHINQLYQQRTKILQLFFSRANYTGEYQKALSNYDIAPLKDIAASNKNNFTVVSLIVNNFANFADTELLSHFRELETLTICYQPHQSESHNSWDKSIFRLLENLLRAATKLSNLVLFGVEHGEASKDVIKEISRTFPAIRHFHLIRPTADAYKHYTSGNYEEFTIVDVPLKGRVLVDEVKREDGSGNGATPFFIYIYEQ